MTGRTQVGLIGAGKIGRVHAKDLVFRIPEAEQVAVSDVYLEAAKQCAADYQIPRVYDDHRPILEDSCIEAVLICVFSGALTPTLSGNTTW